MRRVHRLLHRGRNEVVDADLANYFGEIPHAELMKSAARRVSDGRMLGLVKAWLEMPVVEEDGKGGSRRTNRARKERKGTPQGAPIPPLLSNIHMRRFILGWKVLGHARRFGAEIVNYADDLRVLGEAPAAAMLAAVNRLMARLKLPDEASVSERTGEVRSRGGCGVFPGKAWGWFPLQDCRVFPLRGAGVRCRYYKRTGTLASGRGFCHVSYREEHHETLDSPAFGRGHRGHDNLPRHSGGRRSRPTTRARGMEVTRRPRGASTVAATRRQINRAKGRSRGPTPGPAAGAGCSGAERQPARPAQAEWADLRHLAPLPSLTGGTAASQVPDPTSWSAEEKRPSPCGVRPIEGDSGTAGRGITGPTPVDNPPAVRAL